MSEEINIQIALIDILQREMQTAWEHVRSYLEQGEIERVWESLNGYLDATNSIFSEQYELRVLIRKHCRVISDETPPTAPPSVNGKDNVSKIKRLPTLKVFTKLLGPFCFGSEIRQPSRERRCPIECGLG